MSQIIHPLFTHNPLQTDEDKVRFLSELQVAIAAGAVASFQHPDKPYLTGYDYTRECQCEKMWDVYPVARFCRGLVWNSKENRIATLPFSKFMNLGEAGCDVTEKELLSVEEVIVETKEDGSLGLLFYDDRKWEVMTRGSFKSDQCIMASTWIDQPAASKYMDVNCTYLAEIVYAENRIVVDYGTYEGFIFFGCYNIHYGYYYPVDTLSPTISKSLLQKTKKNVGRRRIKFDDVLALMPLLTENEEGFVLQLDDGRRCKMKGEKYLTLHKAKFGLSRLSVFDSMQQGTVDKMIKEVPEEFHPLMFSYLDELSVQFKTVFKRYTEVLMEVERECTAAHGREYTRKDYALVVQSKPSEYHGFCFAKFSKEGNKISQLRADICMGVIRPTGNKLQDI